MKNKKRQPSYEERHGGDLIRKSPLLQIAIGVFFVEVNIARQNRHANEQRKRDEYPCKQLEK
jgi:hypothetical protein